MRHIFFAVIVAVSFDSHGFCFEQVGKRYHIDPLLLKAVAITENASLDPRAINRKNSDGTVDYGLTQTNSWWLEPGRGLHEQGVTHQRLLSEPCLSVSVAGWILANNFARHGVSKDSLGGYNAGFAQKKARLRASYAERVLNNLKKLKKGVIKINIK